MPGMRSLAIFGALGAVAGFLTGKKRKAAPYEYDSSERGRSATSPAEMTALGWKDILIRTWHESFEDRLFSEAAGVAFFGLLALVPSLSVLISIYGLITSPADIDAQLEPLFSLIPDGARALVLDQAKRISSQPPQALSLALGLNLAFALWSANAGIKALFDALNVIYDEKEKRSLVKLNAISLMVTASAAVLLVLSILLIAIVPTVLAWLPYTHATEWAFLKLRWPVFFVGATLSIAALFWIGPSRTRVRFLWTLPGAIVAALLWLGVSSLFSLYVSKFGNYQVTYGSLAAVVVFMTWLWLSACAVLLGAEFNSELEHQTAHDTTEGAPRPIGSRGAAMADSVGPRTD